MLWARIETGDGRILTGVVEGDHLTPRAALGADEAAGAPVALEGARMLAPCVPSKFVCLWNNFHAAAEKNGWTPPEHPLFLLKPPSALSGPGASVAMPAGMRRVTYEGELGIVIGKTCRGVSEEEAAEAILGFTCVNDITALDVLNADPAFPQWTRAKGFDGFGAIGPVIATGLDWRELTIRTLVGDRERQSYPASDMIFGPEAIVSLLSRDMTLSPGDVIACGTSLGVRPVKAGDAVTVRIEGIGDLPVEMVEA
jgi:2-keto-4-pentenoate hydratase/2-oxohepta-3-ene-1,7-dioic acid hydratase in catechol pathway